MTDAELRNLIQDGGIGWELSGWLSLVFFASAWYLNHRLEGNKKAPFIVFPFAIIASLMLYTSPWSVSLSALVERILGTWNMPVVTVMGLVCVLAIVATVVDLWFDSTYNPAAVAALMIAPIMAHGAGGGVGAFVNDAYASLAVIAIGLVTSVFGV